MQAFYTSPPVALDRSDGGKSLPGLEDWEKGMEWNGNGLQKPTLGGDRWIMGDLQEGENQLLLNSWR